MLRHVPAARQLSLVANTCILLVGVLTATPAHAERPNTPSTTDEASTDEAPVAASEDQVAAESAQDEEYIEIDAEDERAAAAVIGTSVTPIVGVDGKLVIIESQKDSGAKLGSYLPVFRIVTIADPLTGAPVSEALKLGLLKVVKVGKRLSLAVVVGALVADTPPAPGDYVAIPEGAIKSSKATHEDKKTKAPPEGSHMHDGAFVRLAIGGGVMNGNFRGDVGQDAAAAKRAEDVALTGGILTSELLVGGSLVPGLVLAGRLAMAFPKDGELDFTELGFDSNAEVNGFAMAVIGTALDFYPFPDFGFHVFGNLGMTTGTLESNDDRVGKVDLFGVAYGVGVGLEGFMSDNWSMGIQAKVDAAAMYRISGSPSDRIVDESFTMASPVVNLTFTYH